MYETDENETTRALAVVSPAAPAPITFTEEVKQAIRQSIAKDCTEAQFIVFMMAAERMQLDPSARQIVPIVQAGKMTPQVTIDGFRTISERTGKYAGMLGPFWCGKDGVWHDVWLEDGPPAAAKVGILRRDFAEPIWGVCRYKSYAKGGNWLTMPDVMSAKVAESLARRIAFPQELSGVYTPEEMGTGPDTTITYTEAAEASSAASQSRQTSAKGTVKSDTRANGTGKAAAYLIGSNMDDNARFKALGLTTPNAVKGFLVEHGVDLKALTREAVTAALDAAERDARTVDAEPAEAHDLATLGTVVP